MGMDGFWVRQNSAYLGRVAVYGIQVRAIKWVINV